jgi:hypothetical protein
MIHWAGAPRALMDANLGIRGARRMPTIIYLCRGRYQVCTILITRIVGCTGSFAKRQRIREPPDLSRTGLTTRRDLTMA